MAYIYFNIDCYIYFARSDWKFSGLCVAMHVTFVGAVLRATCLMLRDHQRSHSLQSGRSSP